MATPKPVSKYFKPTAKSVHSSVVIDSELYNWCGDQRGFPEVHDSAEKKAFVSNIDVLDLHTGIWTNMPTTGDPHPGVWGYACVAIDKNLIFFGGYCGHVGCYHNDISQLDSTTLKWNTLATGDHQRDGPMKKAHCGMMPFTCDKHSFLFLIGGFGSPPNNRQHNAEYQRALFGIEVRTNEQHIYDINTGRYVTPVISGHCPPPCSDFTYTRVTNNSGIMFGGLIDGGNRSDAVYITKLTKNTVHWEKMASKFWKQWPGARFSHAATIIDDVLYQRSPALVVIGGYGTSDCRIMDIEKRSWRKLILPASVTDRYRYSLSSYMESPHCVLLVVSGGYRDGRILDDIAIVQLVLQDGQWTVGNVLEDVSSTDVYQTLLSQHHDDERRKEEMLKVMESRHASALREKDKVIQQMQQEKDRLQQENDQFQQEKNRMQQDFQSVQQEKDRAHLENVRIVQQNEQLQRENEQILRERDQLVQDREQPHWMVRKEEVELTSVVLGAGAYGEVKIANFRGTRVAAKCIHDIILSPYNLGLFSREMEIASRLRHPNLVQFIGATREGAPIIISELMSTSLNKELEQSGSGLDRPVIINISRDVACGLNYLHLWKPQPILHRDISSPNILLEGVVGRRWKAKLSDFGSSNVQSQTRTEAPGNPYYASPEAPHPRDHSPAMDVFSYGVMVTEMIVHEPPGLTVAEKRRQIESIKWSRMKDLVVGCVDEDRGKRPSISEVLAQLDNIK